MERGVRRPWLLLGLAGIVALLIAWFLPGERVQDPWGPPSTESETPPPTLRGTGNGEITAVAAFEAPMPPEPAPLVGIVVDTDGHPVPDAQVRLGSDETASDDAGAFELPPPAFDGMGRAGVLVATRAGHGSAQVEVRRGRQRPLRVVLPASREIDGLVTSADGSVTGVLVILTDGAHQSAVTTTHDGRFWFRDARTRRCEIRTQAAGYFPAHADIEANVAPHEILIWLKPVPDVAVHVVDPEGNPVAGAHVTARWSHRRDIRLEGVSNPDGFAFRVPALGGPSQVFAEADGFIRGGSSLSHGRIEDDITIRLRRQTVVQVRIDPEVAPSERAAWTVALGSNRRAVPAQSPRGEFAMGSPGRAADIGSVRSDRWAAFDDNGVATLDRALAGVPYAIVAVRRDRSGNEECHRRVIWRTESLPAVPPMIPWSPPELALLEIRTADPHDGSPVPVKLRLHGTGLERYAADLPSTPSRGIYVRTGADGVGRAWLLPAKYHVNWRKDREFAVEEIEFPNTGMTLELPASRGHQVRGRVASRRGAPLADRFVSILTDYETGEGARTDAAGHFVIRRVFAGRHQLWFQGEHGSSRHGPVSVTVPSGPLSLVAPSCTLRGVVVPAPTVPTVVALRHPHNGGGRTPSARLDENGHFEMTGLSAGTWHLRVWRVADGMSLAEQEVEVTGGAYVEIRTR